ncbi:MAG: hypothetical protein M1825_002918 [Sarcosagium campestre]|nr:MAG: hypothetical protein M1825_002918 [Sarcosagium campestre]
MATQPPIIRRALLYVPGSSPRFLASSRKITSVDSIAYDLEDSVSVAEKPGARAAVLDVLSQPRVPGIREQGVRINSLESGLAEADLDAVLRAPNLDTIIVPKVHTGEELAHITSILRRVLPERHPTSAPIIGGVGREGQHERQQQLPPPPVRILALIESARALHHLPAICESTPYLSGLILGAEDLALDLSLTRTPSLTEFLYARSRLTTVARAFGISSVLDLVCTAYGRGAESEAVLRDECRAGRGLGFGGKQVVHPSQVAVVQEGFAPAEQEVLWAARVCVAADKADRGGRGAWGLDGKMVDAPVIGRARAVVGKARACGVDVDQVLKREADVEPE